MDKKFGISKQQTKTLKTMETVIKKIGEHYQNWESAQQGQTSGYEYEKSFVEMWNRLGADIFRQSIGDIPGDKNKKKLQCCLGKIEVPKHHVLSRADSKFGVSQYMSELMCYMGQEMVYETASETMEKLMSTNVNAKQIERLCHHYGQKLEDAQGQAAEDRARPKSPSAGQTEYIQMDGSMMLTREEKWKELKLCRIFSGDSRIEISKDRGYVSNSTYIGHLGPHKDFLEKVERHTDRIKNKVIIADGAKWIWNWAEDSNDDSIQILDFYHAKEHLCQFAQLQYKDAGERGKWIDRHALLLLNDKVDQVIKELEQISASNQKAEGSRIDLIGYYQRNAKRMKYGTFREAGLLIGSGAIEAAHRHVVQQRMKLSGQRWTKQGAQQLLNIRMARKSNQWNQLVELITQQKAA